MAGWRIAYMLIPESLEVAVKKIQDTNLICPPLVSQMAAMAAMKEGKPWIDDQVSDFSEVRKLVLDALRILVIRFPSRSRVVPFML